MDIDGIFWDRYPNIINDFDIYSKEYIEGNIEFDHYRQLMRNLVFSDYELYTISVLYHSLHNNYIKIFNNLIFVVCNIERGFDCKRNLNLLDELKNKFVDINIKAFYTYSECLKKRCRTMSE